MENKRILNEKSSNEVKPSYVDNELNAHVNAYTTHLETCNDKDRDGRGSFPEYPIRLQYVPSHDCVIS